MLDKTELSNRQNETAEDTLIPDLCRGEALFSVVLIAELMALLITVSNSGVRHFDWLLFSASSMIALWVTLLSALVLCLLKDYIHQLGNHKAAALSYALVILVAMVCGICVEMAAMFYGDKRDDYFNVWKVFDYLLVAGIPAGVLLRYLFLQQQLRIQQRAELDARIQALQSRIRPHFLFNSMNVIASLIHSNPEKAEQAVEDISDLFRSALSGSEVLVPLKKELSLCRRYLALEQLRLGDRLSSRWEIGDYGDTAKVPPLSIQPLVENAIYHGIQLLPEGGEIVVSVEGVGDVVEIVITNPLTRLEQQRSGNQMAIKNIAYRLQAHFGESASIVAKPGDSVFEIKITIPSCG